jgi:hypothetical protein
MGTVLLSNKFKHMEHNENTLDHIKTHADAVIHFIKNLDIDMVDDLLDEKYTYQVLKKNIFIQQFSVAFDEFIDAGDTHLEVSTGFCNELICGNQCSGYRFISKSSGLYFDLIIEIEDGKVKDIYECKSFMCLSSDTNANKRVRIDRRDFKINIEKPPNYLF